MIWFRLSRALSDTPEAEAEETGLEAGGRATTSAEDCQRLLEDLRLARRVAENSIQDAGCFSRKKMSEMEKATTLLNEINNK